MQEVLSQESITENEETGLSHIIDIESTWLNERLVECHWFQLAGV